MQCGDTDVWTFDPYDGYTDLGLGMMATPALALLPSILPRSMPSFSKQIQAIFGQSIRLLGPVDRGLGMMLIPAPARRSVTRGITVRVPGQYRQSLDDGSRPRCRGSRLGNDAWHQSSIVLLADPEQIMPSHFRAVTAIFGRWIPTWAPSSRAGKCHAGFQFQYHPSLQGLVRRSVSGEYQQPVDHAPISCRRSPVE